MLAATGMLSLFTLVGGSGVAHAVSLGVNEPGVVTCVPAHGPWSGTISFAPALINGGTATTEVMVVKAALGNTGNLCSGSTGIAALGNITGKLTFNIAGANNCATIFSGAALAAPAAGSKFKMTWSVPAGANPTRWKMPGAFVVTGALNESKITVRGGAVAGSFTPFAAPKANLSDANWPAAIPAGCASPGGLASLTLNTSKGRW